MVRAPYIDRYGTKKGAWNEEEDNKLRAVVQGCRNLNWRLVPQFADLARCGKSCRLRWMNYLKPGVRRGNFKKQEEDLIIELHARLGNKWSLIAKELPGRTDNDIKNFWHTRIKKRCKQNPATSEKVTRHSTIEASATIHCKNTRSESDSSDASSLINLQESTPSFDSGPPLLPIVQPQVDLWPDDVFPADISCNQTDCFPPLLEQAEIFYPELHCSELSSSGSSSVSGLDWISDDDHSLRISSGYVAPVVQGGFWSESFASDASNSGVEASYVAPPQEVGGFCDPFFQYFDYGMNLFTS